MAIVVDASLVVVLATGDPRIGIVESWLRRWQAAGEDLHAPTLLTYEVQSALTRLVKAGHLEAADVPESWSIALALPIILHHQDNGPRAVEIALHLRRSSAYDAAYIALTERLSGEMWTLDASLARNASALGYRVRHAEEE